MLTRPYYSARHIRLQILTALMIFSFICIPSFTKAQQINIVTENFPPFHYVENKQLKGSVIDLMKPVLKQFNLTSDNIIVYPWARAYQIAEREPNTLIFSLARFPAREKLFKWVAPVGYIKVGVFKLKSRTDIHISTLTDINNYSSAVFVDSAAHHFFEQENFENFETLGEFDSLAKMLMRGRIDLVPASSHSFLSRVSAMGFDANDIELIYYIKELEKGLWTAFNTQTDDKLVLKMRHAITEATTFENVLSLPLQLNPTPKIKP